MQIDGARVVPGNFVSLTLVFDSGQSSTIKVPVVENTEDYADVPLPSAASSATPAAE